MSEGFAPSPLTGEGWDGGDMVVTTPTRARHFAPIPTFPLAGGRS